MPASLIHIPVPSVDLGSIQDPIVRVAFEEIVRSLDGMVNLLGSEGEDSYVAGSVDTDALGALAVTAAKLAADAVETVKIKDLAVATSKLAALAVTAAKLATDAVETAKIKDLNVTAAKLATDAVETAKIKDAAVTAAKLASGVGSPTLFQAGPNSGTSAAAIGTWHTMATLTATFNGNDVQFITTAWISDSDDLAEVPLRIYDNTAGAAVLVTPAVRIPVLSAPPPYHDGSYGVIAQYTPPSSGSRTFLWQFQTGWAGSTVGWGNATICAIEV